MSQNNPKWRVRTPRAGEAAGVEVYDGDQYVCQMSHHPAYRAQSAEYARRIVACVNACEGVPTEVLEVQTVLEKLREQDTRSDAELKSHNLHLQAEYDRAHELRKDAEAQRDELLAALESLILFTKPSKSNAVALNNAHAAIASAKGGAA